MGALSQDDIIRFLIDINNTIFELNKNYTNNMEKIGIKTINSFITKLNVTNKAKLKKSVLNSITPFSFILSKEAYNNLKDNMLIQYNNLDNYIINFTNYLHNKVNDLELKLQKTSDYLYLVNDIGYQKILGYYNMLSETIETKYRLIDDEDDDDDGDDDIEGPNEIDKDYFEHKGFKTIKNNINKFVGATIGVMTKYEIQTKGILVDFLKGENKQNDEEDDDDSEMSADLTVVLGKNGFKQFGLQVAKKITLFEIELPIPPIIIWFTPFPCLQIRIAPLAIFGLYFEMGKELKLLKNEYSVFLDIYGSAEVSLSLELGVYIPPYPVGTEISLSIGIKGLLGSGKVGMKLSINIQKPLIIKVKLEIELKLMQFTFFILFKVKVDLKFIKFSFQFYLMNEQFFDGIGFKKSLKKEYKLLKIIDIAAKLYAWYTLPQSFSPLNNFIN